MKVLKKLTCLCGALCLPIFIAVAAVAGENGVSKEWTVPPMAASKKNPIEPTEKALKAGRKIFIRTCGSCHGKQGEGDGSAGKDLEVPPADLTTEKVQSQSDGALFWKIYNGRSPMPAYGQNAADAENVKTDEEIWQVVHYLRRLVEKDGGEGGK